LEGERTVTDFERVPVNALLGLRLVRSEPNSATVEVQPSPDLLQEHGVVHGGVLAPRVEGPG
jgi:acyl-coenzyme A thioesterase PaaI-like protein